MENVITRRKNLKSGVLKLAFVTIVAIVTTIGCRGPMDISDSVQTGVKIGKETGPVKVLAVGNNVVFLPEGYETAPSQPTGDFQGVTVLTGGGEVAGFAAQTDAGGAADAEEVGDNDETTISGDGNIAGVSKVGSNTEGDIYTARYVLTYGATAEPIEVSNRLLELIGVSSAGGSVSASGLLTGMSASAASATQTDTFRLILTVKYNNSGEVVKTVAVTPDSSFTAYEAQITAFVDGTNIGTAGMVRATTQDTFTAQSGPTIADFLFVVDDSGSMSNEQSAVSQAASDFWDALSTTGLDFNVGVISTGSTYQLEGSGFTGDRTTFETDVVLGTTGSPIETGIYNAEQALSPGGPVEAAGYPRAGASISVIVLSDEPSQYESRGGSSFDPSDNLFVDNGYRFYSIINSSWPGPGQYEDLSNVTGGSAANITDLTVFPQIMSTIASAAGGAASSYKLTQSGVINATIQVTVNETVVPKSSENGWSYISSSNSVVFYGSAIPTGGDSVNVSYQWKQ